MINLTELFNDNELKYIISVIPTSSVRSYFKRYPKDFQKTFPGFRTTANLPFEKFVTEIKRNNDFIITLISGFLEQSVKEIDEAIAEAKKEDIEEIAVIKTLSCSHFSSNPNIYFKLKNEERDESVISILSAAIKLYVEISKENNTNKSELEDIKKKHDELSEKYNEQSELIKSLYSEIENCKLLNTELKQKLEIVNGENEQLKFANQTLIDDIKKANEEVESLKTRNLDLQKQISLLQVDKKRLIAESEEIRERLHTSIEKLEELQTRLEILDKDIETKDLEISELQEKLKNACEVDKRGIENSMPIAGNTTLNQNNDIIPTIETIAGLVDNHKNYLLVKDYDEFKEDLNYCLEDAKVYETKEVLSSYLDRLYSERKIIVGNRKDCKFVADCFSSILCAGKYTTITFYEGIKLREIIGAVENGGRIIYLDNFIGNYNETVLISVLSSYQDKTIVISAMYDKMFMYITSDILRDCNYINLQRLNLPEKIDFDECNCLEEATTKRIESIDNAPTMALLSILRDLGLSEQVRKSLATNINNHIDADGILTFGIIPYLVDVRGESPFENSDRLMSYYEKNRNNRFTMKWFIYG